MPSDEHSYELANSPNDKQRGWFGVNVEAAESGRRIKTGPVIRKAERSVGSTERRGVVGYVTARIGYAVKIVCHVASRRSACRVQRIEDE